jgi:lipoprotein-anchoring transpeptidase ErfK/SrfK
LAPATDDITRYSVIAKSGKVLQAASSFAGAFVDSGFAFPAAWVLRTTQPSAVPGGAPDKTAPVRARYSMVYLYASVKYRGLPWYLVGPGQWLSLGVVAKVQPVTKPVGVSGRWVSVDLRQQVLTAYEEDRLVFTTLISSGLPGHQTREGLFHVWIHLPTDDMNGSMGQPDAYSLPYVPYVMYFDHNIALHGAYWHDAFGFPRSHGCVNMSLSDSHWLYDWTSPSADTSVYVWRSK